MSDPRDADTSPDEPVANEVPGSVDGPLRTEDESFRHTRTSAAWVAITVAVLFGVALIDFIAQNTRHVRIEFFWTSSKIPIAVALLGAALCGAVVVLAIGIARVAQLRLHVRRQRRSRGER